MSKSQRRPEDLLSDLFLQEHLNPLFLQALQPYWKTAFEPNDSVSKEEINNIRSELIRFVFRRLTKKLFVESHKHFKHGHLFLLTYVHGDGLGDFFALLNSARVYRQAFPEMDIEVAFTHHQQLPQIDPSDYDISANGIHDFHETAITQHVLEPILEGKSKLSFENALNDLIDEKRQTAADFERMREQHGHESEPLKEMLADLDMQIRRFEQAKKLKKKAIELYESLQKCDALVHISLAINTFENPLLSHKSLYFSETGNFQGIANSLAFQWYSEGMLPFEEGIFLHKNVDPHSAWKDGRVPQFFWNTKTPSEQDYAKYSKSHQLYMGYFPRIPEQLLIFIYYTAVAQKENARHLDLFLPKIYPEVLEAFNTEWLEKHKIQKIVLVEFTNDEINTEMLFESSKIHGKTMRLICLAPIPEKDFYHLMHISGELVGCTGDMSLSECLKANKIPFYELRKHKQETWLACKEIVKYLNLPLLIDYFHVLESCRENAPEVTAVKVVEILSSGEFYMAWQIFVDFIRRYYCLEDALVGYLSRYLHFARNPKLKGKEDLLVKWCLDGQLSMHEAYRQFQEELSS